METKAGGQTVMAALALDTPALIAPGLSLKTFQLSIHVAALSEVALPTLLSLVLNISDLFLQLQCLGVLG